MIRAGILALLLAAPAVAGARETVSASPPESVSVTVYRDPQRQPGSEVDPDMPDGFAMISETRTVVLPPGPSTIRFEGVAEGMVAVSAIVTGLPGGVIEKNRNADLLSPAALVDGSLGNRVTITRTNPATGKATSESAVIRTRADGGLVLQTREGYEAVRCSGLPEKLQFDRVPAGLSASPVFSIDANEANGGTYRITLTYLASGFDWQADYVATLKEGGGGSDEREMRLLAWLTIANGNGQAFPDAQLLAVAGKLNVESDYRDLADPPTGRPLRLTCYAAEPPPPPPMGYTDEDYADAAGEIVVTATRRMEALQAAPIAVAMIASEEQLGDLKLYRIPERIGVAPQSLKQVAFLNLQDVKGRLVHTARCSPWDDDDDPRALGVLLRMKNDKKSGLGVALPMGTVALFEPTPRGDLLLGEPSIRDYAVDQDVEMNLEESAQAFGICKRPKREAGESSDPDDGKWHGMEAVISNANNHAIAVDVALGEPGEWEFRKTPGRTRLLNGQQVVTVRIPKEGSKTLRWQFRKAEEKAEAGAE